MVGLNAAMGRANVFSLGQPCKFALHRQDPRVEVRAFLRHHGILYLQPVSDWATEDVIRLFLEAPGDYVLAIQWRSPAGDTGWFEHSFEVMAGSATETTPGIVQIDGATRIWTTSAWEAGLVVGYEASLVSLLNLMIKPGWVIYDIGANVGLHSIRFARLAGAQGHVYCIEANPLCVYFLRANLQLNKVTNFSILPVALLADLQVCNFLINYYNVGLGITSASPLYTTKLGHQIAVQSDTLDHILETFQLRKPDLIKIDIEGAEGLAVAGMEQTLARDRPILVVEVHGRIAAEQTLRQLGRLDYRFRDISTQMEFDDPDDLLRDFPEAVVQILARPK